MLIDNRQYLFSQGFSLIELMIVVAIIGVLAAIAIPSYQTYTYKAKFTEVVQATAPFKLAVESCAHELGDINGCINSGDGTGQNGIPPAVSNADSSNGYVKSVSVVSKGSNTVTVVAASQHIGKSTDSYTYLLNGSLLENGQVEWVKDASSSCRAAGLC